MANATALISLSGSTQGKPIKVVATSTPGTNIHTTGISNTILDRIRLFAFNSDTLTRTLTVEWGGFTAPDQNIVLDIPSRQGLFLVVDDLILFGNSSVGLSVTAFASAANVITLNGSVYRITP